MHQTSASKPGTTQVAVNLDLPPPSQLWAASNLEQMEVDYGPALPPHLGADHHMTLDQPSSPAEEPSKASVRPKTHSHSHKRHVADPRSASDQLTDESDEPRIASSRSKKDADKRKHKVRSRNVSSSSEEDQSSVVRHRSYKPSGAASDEDLPQHDPDLSYYSEVALSDVSSQYAEEVDTLFPSLTPGSVCLSPQLLLWAWMMKKAFKSSVIKDAFDKFEHDFQAANLPESKYIKRPPSTTKWYKVGQPCHEEKIQELNTDFAHRSVLLQNPLGLLWARFPY